MRLWIADDQASLVVLDSSGKDLASACAELADLDDQGAFPGDVLVFVEHRDHASVRILDLNDRAVIDKQSCCCDGFGERSSAVSTKIQNAHIDVGFVEFLEDDFKVFRCPPIVFLVRASTFHVEVEAW